MEGEQPHLGDLLTMVINHLLTGMILQVLLAVELLKLQLLLSGSEATTRRLTQALVAHGQCAGVGGFGGCYLPKYVPPWNLT